jgi:hypothetical protein
LYSQFRLFIYCNASHDIPNREFSYAIFSKPEELMRQRNQGPMINNFEAHNVRFGIGQSSKDFQL